MPLKKYSQQQTKLFIRSKIMKRGSQDELGFAAVTHNS